MTGNLSKSRAKYIKSLQQKKYRDEHNQFVVEGVKLVAEAIKIPGLVDFVVYSNEFQTFDFKITSDSYSASAKELGMISALRTPNKILAVCHKIDSGNKPNFQESILALEDISDPGNFGTIIRLADWFGFSQIICSLNSVDLYNPKVVQATMGGIFRVDCFSENLRDILSQAPGDMPVYGADMEGDDLYTGSVQSPFVLVMGSESHGLSADLRKQVSSFVSIPRFGGGESLNVAVSTGIILSEFKRKLTVGE